MSLLWILNLALKPLTEATYWSPQFLQEIMQTTLGLLQDRIPLTLYALSVTLH